MCIALGVLVRKKPAWNMDRLGDGTMAFCRNKAN